MLRSGILLLWICTALGISARLIPAADIGSIIEDFSLSDLTGENHSLRSYSGKIVVLVFWSYKCPYSNAYTHQIDELQNKHAKNGVVVLGVASGTSETAAGIKANKDSMKFRFPVLLDTEGKLASRLNATRTPSVFIIDGTGVLRYKGDFDHAEYTIDALRAGRPVEVSAIEVTKGCRIQR
jgi:peroxiredoxin